MTLPNESKCIVRGTGQDSGERRERTRRAESWLGEPTKQNGDESRARLGRQAVKRSQCATRTEADGEQAVPQWPTGYLGELDASAKAQSPLITVTSGRFAEGGYKRRMQSVDQRRLPMPLQLGRQIRESPREYA